MHGKVWMFSHLIDDEDIEFMQHEFISYRQAMDYYNLGYKPIVRLDECREYSVSDLFCCGYARYFWEAVKIRYPEYCFYRDWEDSYAEG